MNQPTTSPEMHFHHLWSKPCHQERSNGHPNRRLKTRASEIASKSTRGQQTTLATLVAQRTHVLVRSIALAAEFEVSKEDVEEASKRAAVPRACLVLELSLDPLLTIVVHCEQ